MAVYAGIKMQPPPQYVLQPHVVLLERRKGQKRDGYLSIRIQTEHPYEHDVGRGANLLLRRTRKASPQSSNISMFASIPRCKRWL